MTSTVATIIRSTGLALVASMLVATGPLTSTAAAETAYRYWSYWHGNDGTWIYATEGSGTRVPADGDVEGWRFGISDDADEIQPRIAPDFAVICAGVDEPASGKRVGVILDPGGPLDAPDGQAPGDIRSECIIADERATGYQVLSQVAQVRTDAGFVCGIDGYPTGECAPLVEKPAATPSAPSPERTDADADADADADVSATESQEPSTDSGAVGTPLITAVSVSLLALVGFGLWRRQRSASRS